MSDWEVGAELDIARRLAARRSYRDTVIEQCALAVEAYLADADHYCDARNEVAAAIRALKDKPQGKD